MSCPGTGVPDGISGWASCTPAFEDGAGNAVRQGRSGGPTRVPGYRSASRNTMARLDAWVAMFGCVSPKSWAISEYRRIASVQFPESSVETASFQRPSGLLFAPTAMAGAPIAGTAANPGAAFRPAPPIASRRR